MAAQQIVCSFFYTFIPIADSLSLTAQSFLPALMMTNNVNNDNNKQVRAKTLRHTILNFLKAAGLFGAALASMVATIPLLVRFFTSDPAVAALVNSVVPILFCIFVFHGVFCASEGLLLAQKDLIFLGRMYAAYFVVVPYFMQRIKWMASTTTTAATGAAGVV
eukprot:CAMPEP_0118703714 /NCGR_PEP_ID=MMETSP0800-20121206/18747_1 /TAXON_ID=210618 ORGANISM="Striatella unipunctata, Strain CCMP2910" /NCGR_SAMPLE_ID=MMETSP0800 /ASSEMBLY_ACC=CAM_ASM_000638 /LENGTH=162 /DNA_ID=CAMNT_0006605351 /DNA_START=140 /DNA_END=625 /DNA_ORIENTATION=-